LYIATLFAIETRDRRLKDEEHGPNNKQTKRQKIER
jgi:hypothetical protein